MRGRWRDRRSGFSIIELIVYVTIFAVIGTLGATTLDFALRTKKVSTRTGEVFINTQRALAQIVERVHLATTVKSTTTSSTLDLNMASSSINPTKFTLVGGALAITEGSNATTTVTPSTLLIDRLEFMRVLNASSTTNSSSTSVQIIISAGWNDNNVLDETTRYTLETTAMPF